jgi:hypothetical protein
MRDGFGFIIFIGIIFLGWLMWSSKSDKEVFLFYLWAVMIGGGTLFYVVKFSARWLEPLVH